MKLILKNLLLSSLLAFALANDEETNSQQFLRKLQTAAKIVSKTSNLGLCEGDCSNDASCRGDLVCHQRNAGDSAPGCSLTSNQRKSRADFCVAARGGSPNPAPAASPVRSPPTGGGGGGGNSFALKLYWQSDYYWQEEKKERKWCLNCKGGCNPGSEIAIYDCADSPTQWQFVSRGPNEVQIKVANRDVCIQEKAGNDLELEKCDSSNQKQRFIASGGSFNDRRFEVSPKQRRGWCMTQRHHPRTNEAVNIEPCTTARRGDTSYWNKY
ncbi:hypothetical protein FisN_24Hh022 [Fistulifera solaris]|uniref:Uncharacterized protein n=1 Tax=Fistulifera solaris TaxID=1519565 RepID=A0A1Z5KIZ7_FISSO|nr:hypothetical protein FisN_24Hh022 [Fistulifera solaris]|eukprot:GAX26105.1 hypothetical protein FisN_24Hh022 [Fistulifera solaris]